MLGIRAHVWFSCGTISFYGPSVAVLQAIAPGFFFLTQEKYALASGENIFLPPFSEILHFFSRKALSRETQLFSTLRARFRAQGGLVAFRECPQSMQKPIPDISIFFMPA